MIHIYRFYKMHVLLSLFIVPSYFSYLISYTNGMFRMSGISLFIPVILPVVDVFLVPYFEFSTSDRYTKKFQKIR